MATTGYMFLSRNLQSHDEDLAWMKDFGCDSIIEESGSQEKLRPEWRRMLAGLRKGDTVVVSRLGNALRGIRELGAFLDLCNEVGVRIVSIHDRIDSGNLLFPDTTQADILRTIGGLSAEATAIRRSENRMLMKRKGKVNLVKDALRVDREKAIVNMYNSGVSMDDIWRMSGFKSRTSVFRVLNRNGVELNRGRHQGPIKKRSERKTDK
jgi:DNA invertase Pin-like site-specific DNA recombinase